MKAIIEAGSATNIGSLSALPFSNYTNEKASLNMNVSVAYSEDHYAISVINRVCNDFLETLSGHP